MRNQYYLNPPSQQLFYSIMAFVLSVMALNTGHWKFYKMPKQYFWHLQRCLVKPSVPVAVVSQLLYLFLNYRELNFNTLAMIFTVLPVTVIVLVKLIVSQTPGYVKVMVEFMDQIHVYNVYANNKKPHVEEILMKTEKYSRWTFYSMSVLCYMCVMSFLSTSIIHNIYNNESIHNITTRLEIMVHFWLPFDYEFNFYRWLVAQTVTTYCVFMAVTIVIFFDVTNLVFLYHLIGHINILKYMLENEFYDKMDDKLTRNKLIEITRYYTFIQKIFKLVEEAFGINVVGIYLHNLIGGSILIYQIMSSGADTGTLMSFGLMIPIYMGELLIMSFVMENIRIKADEIPELVYNLSWEKMKVSNQKLVLMILFQVQPILEFKAAFNIKTGVQPAINIIKTTLSYYLMIKARM